jgi:signal transduction histidine kinase/ActR/RegA family two-component response regulator
MTSQPTCADERVLVLAPRGRDQQVILQVLGESGFGCAGIASLGELAAAIETGAGAVLVAEESLHGADLAHLLSVLERQEPWSDFPFVVLVEQHIMQSRPDQRSWLDRLGNVIVLERPLNTQTLRSATSAALRARRRQYHARDLLVNLKSTAHSLECSRADLVRLNETLEVRIDERTRALALANDRLLKEAFERERVQQALVQFQKMEAVGRLTGGIAHDFNNLLNVVQGSMDLILMLSGDEVAKGRAEVARRACKQGAKLTSQLLAFSRNQRLDLDATDVVALLEGVQSLLAASLGAGIRFRVEVEEQARFVTADLNQMEMALINLAINARDAMPAGGELIIRADRASPPAELLPPGEYVRISVIDSGVGIRPDILAKVFEPFFTTKEVGKGTGLGLSQVYGMAQQSGGTARVHSAVGVGTTVELWLCAASAPATAPVENRTGKPNVQGASARILVVEDDSLVRHSMVESLEALGYSVTAACDAEAGLAELRREKPHLMITDYLMPGMTGAQLVQVANHEWPGLPMIISTGYADMDAIADVIGDNIVLRKPFQLADLAHSVERALHKERCGDATGSAGLLMQH